MNSHISHIISHQKCQRAEHLSASITMTTETYKFSSDKYSYIISVEIGDDDCFKFCITIKYASLLPDSVKCESNWLRLTDLPNDLFTQFCDNYDLHSKLCGIYFKLYYNHIYIKKELSQIQLIERC